MPRFSLLVACCFVAACAGYFALIAVAGQDEDLLASWLAKTLGLLYETVLYASGLSAIFVACRTSWRAASPSAVAVAIPITILPAFIGLIGLIHGYINFYRILAWSSTNPNPTEMWSMHSTVLVCSLAECCAVD